MNEPARPLWRIPVMWLVIGLPLASIVAGVGLVVIAVKSGGADVVTDKVNRVAQIQTADFGPDERARQSNISAVLRIDGGALEIIPVTGGIERATNLRVQVLHPSRQDGDRTFMARPAGLGWRVEDVDLDSNHDWRVQVSAPNDQWRIKGRLPKHQKAVRLAPALAGIDGT